MIHSVASVVETRLLLLRLRLGLLGNLVLHNLIAVLKKDPLKGVQLTLTSAYQDGVQFSRQPV